MDQAIYDALTDSAKFDALMALSMRASQATDAQHCLNGEAVFFAKDTRARIPGHIYSEAGVREFGISRACEYHFDRWMADPEDDDIDYPEEED